MNRIICFLTAIAMTASLILTPADASVLSVLTINAAAQSVEPPASDFTYTENDDGTLTITKYTGNETDIIFPAEINGKRVKKIGSGEYNDCVIPDGITSVIISNGIEIIDDFAFQWAYYPNNSTLRYVSFPESLATIKVWFDACKLLECIDVDINNQNYCSENGVLFDKNKTILLHYPPSKPDSEYTVPSTVKTINGDAIMNCRYLKKLNILEGTEHIGRNAFWDMSQLEAITIPSTLTQTNGTYLSDMPNTVVICEESVDPNLISDAQSVINYKTENGKTKITNYHGIKENIEIPTDINGSSVTSIGGGAFANTAISSIKIPDTLQSIESGAFDGCNALGTVVYSNNTAVADDAFPADTVQLSYKVTPSGVTVEVVSKGNQDTVTIPDNIGGVPVTNIDVGETGAAVEHNHTGGTATCTEQAVCDICGELYGELLEHTPTEIPAIEPTCTDTGLTAGIKCSVCNAILAEQEVIPTIEHISGDWIVEVPATTASEGVQIKKCTACGIELDRAAIEKLPNISTGDVVEDVQDTAGTNAGLVQDNTLIENTLTPQDKTEVTEGHNFEIVLEVTDIRDSVSAADVTAALSALKSNEEIGIYVDLSLFKIKDNTEKTPIYNTSGQIGIALTIPESIYASDRTYSIIRVHNGAAQNLGGTYDKTSREITFYTDKFSTYAIAYTASNSGTDRPTVPDKPSVPSTPSVPTYPTTPVKPVTPTVTETTVKKEDEIISDEPYVEDVSSAAGIYENGEADSNVHYVLILIFAAAAGIAVIAARKRFCKRNVK